MTICSVITDDSIKWAMEFIRKQSDGDICPSIPEFEPVASRVNDFIADLKTNKNLYNQISANRNFHILKTDNSYRTVNQLYPLDSIIYTAIIYQFAGGIEKRRLGNDVIFSHRFKPTSKHELYPDSRAWNNFWEMALSMSSRFDRIIYCDIADFYNQIYHHTIENQLEQSQFPKAGIKWILSLLKNISGNISRGIPTGPHASHIVAEATLIPLDDALKSKNIIFLRYVDDILIFCPKDKSPQTILMHVGQTLDTQQRLRLQETKTRIYNPHDFQLKCEEMIENRPINEDEDKIIKIIDKYSKGDPYKQITYEDISIEDWETLDESVIKKILNEYLSVSEPNYIKISWFYRRLAQTGHSGAVSFSIQNMATLLPCISSVSRYISGVKKISKEQWENIGEDLVKILDMREIRDNNFLMISLLSLFSKNSDINHFHSLVGKYGSAPQDIERELFLSAKVNRASAWLSEHKSKFTQMNDWQKMAYIYSLSVLPNDEKKHFLNSIKDRLTNSFEYVLWEWSKAQ